jgi:hypothetical protein
MVPYETGPTFFQAFSNARRPYFTLSDLQPNQANPRFSESSMTVYLVIDQQALERPTLPPAKCLPPTPRRFYNGGPAGCSTIIYQATLQGLKKGRQARAKRGFNRGENYPHPLMQVIAPAQFTPARIAFKSLGIVLPAPGPLLLCRTGLRGSRLVIGCRSPHLITRAGCRLSAGFHIRHKQWDPSKPIASIGSPSEKM